MTAAKYITAILASAACTTAGAQQLDCTTPAIVKTVKLIFAENVIIGAEQEMAIRSGLDNPTSPDAMDKGADNLAGALTLRGIRKLDSRGDGFFWCGAEIHLNTAPQYLIPLEYRSRASSDFKSGIQTQAAINFPKGITGFNLLMSMRKALVATIPEEYKTRTPGTAPIAPPVTEKKVRATPSFNCEQPANAAHEMICKSDELSQQDADTRTAFNEARQRAMAAGATRERMFELVDTHRKWQSDRDSCRDEACLFEAFGKRRMELESLAR